MYHKTHLDYIIKPPEMYHKTPQNVPENPKKCTTKPKMYQKYPKNVPKNARNAPLLLDLNRCSQMCLANNYPIHTKLVLTCIEFKPLQKTCKILGSWLAP